MGKIYALSDIHGFYVVMMKTLELVDLSNAANQLIFCGDYIDYGPDSCKVLYKIMELVENYPEQVIALKGNHETMFLEFLDSKDQDIWNIEWLGADKDLGTVHSFLTENAKEEVKRISLSQDDSIDLRFDIAKFVKSEIKTKHKELIAWLRNLPLYYETENQIFVHAGIDEEAEDWWKYGTPEEVFTGKYPATFRKFHKDVIAGHIGTHSLKNEEGFYDIFWDGENHYFIDGTVECSGRIPLLVYDDDIEKYVY